MEDKRRARPARTLLPGYGQSRWGIGVWLGFVLMALAGALIATGEVGQAILVAVLGLTVSVVSGTMAALRSDSAQPTDRRNRIPLVDIGFAILSGFAILAVLRMVD